MCSGKPKMDNKIIEILSLESGLSKDKIALTSTLLGDLNLDGDDAWEVLDYCHRELKLDLSSFHFEQYFHPEPCLKGLKYFSKKLWYKDEHLAANKTPITVHQLINACKRGKW